MLIHELLIRDYHFCITFDFEDESYICYAFWVPYEVYIKDFSKFHHLTPVLSSWISSIYLVELKLRTPTCHTSKVASWHVECWYELHLLWSLSKIWLKVSKSVKNGQYYRKHQFSLVFETLSQILLRDHHKWSSYQQSTCQDTTFDVWQGGILDIWIFNSRRWIENHQEDRTGVKWWNFEKSFIYTS